MYPWMSGAAQPTQLRKIDRGPIYLDIASVCIMHILSLTSVYPQTITYA